MMISAEPADSLKRSDYSRLKKALARQEADRVPYLEYWYVNQQVWEHVLGRKLRTIGWTGKDAKDPVEDVDFARKIGMDAVISDFIYRPNTIYADSDDGENHYSSGTIKGWSDLSLLEPPPSLAEIDDQARRYADAVRGTELGCVHTFTGILDPAYLGMGLIDFMYMLADDPGFIEHLMDYFAYHVRRAIETVVKYPEIEIILFNDDVASGKGLLMGTPRMKEMWAPRVKWVIEPAIKAGKILAYHSDGDLMELIPMLLEMGFCAVHPVEPYANDIYALKKEFGRDITLCGNIDITLLRFGTPAEIEADVKEHCDRLKTGGGYVVSSSNSLIQQIPPQNFLAMTNAVQRYGAF